MDIKDYMQDIYDRRGQLTPADVVEEARSPGHPLHSHFSWDEHENSEKWLLHRAGELIRSVRIEVKPRDEEEAEKKPRTIRAFYSLRNEKGHSYEPAEEIARDPHKREMLLQDMEREWRSLYNRFKEFEEFAELVQKDLTLAIA